MTPVHNRRFIPEASIWCLIVADRRGCRIGWRCGPFVAFHRTGIIPSASAGSADDEAPAAQRCLSQVDHDFITRPNRQQANVHQMFTEDQAH